MTTLGEIRQTNQEGVLREKIIVRTSMIGIVANIFLVIFKTTIGLLSNSIAIVLDAVNNLSDVASSLITIVGTKLAGKEPDKKTSFWTWSNRIFKCNVDCSDYLVCRHYVPI